MARSKPISSSSNSRDVSSVGKGIQIPSKRRRTESGEEGLLVERVETPRTSLVDGNGSPGPRRPASAGPSKALPTRGTTVEGAEPIFSVLAELCALLLQNAFKVAGNIRQFSPVQTSFELE
jgi:hypothetical protein